MDLNTWALFAFTIAVLIAIPGPLTLLMVNSTINAGLKKSLPIILGGSLASAILITISALGLGAVIAASQSLFTTIKYLGAAYLIYLGLSLWLSAIGQAKAARLEPSATHSATHSSKAVELKPNSNLLFKSFILGITNPKDIVFFVAFLPQFINTEQGYNAQLITIVLTWFCVDLLSKVSYGMLAKGLATRLQSVGNSNILDKVSALIFVAAGIAASVT